jgi:general secretion pathway protein K
MQTLLNQKGAALIVALFVTMLVAIMATAMMEAVRINTYRDTLITHSTQSKLYAEGSIAWAKEELNHHWINQKKDRAIDNLPIQSPHDYIENATITSRIDDAQARFNINNLSNHALIESFIRLIRITNPKLSPEKARSIALATVDWIDSEATLSSYDYEKETPPYRAPHRPMAHASELRLVQGVSADIYEHLSPFIIALPEATPINVNHAQAPLLMSLSPSLSKESAEAIMMYRKEHPFISEEQFFSFPIVKNNPFQKNGITVTSRYFLVNTYVKIENHTMVFYTLLQRITHLKNAKEVEWWQNKGSL